MRDYLRLAIRFDNSLANTRYNMSKAMHGHLTTSPGKVNKQEEEVDKGMEKR